MLKLIRLIRRWESRLLFGTDEPPIVTTLAETIEDFRAEVRRQRESGIRICGCGSELSFADPPSTPKP